MGKDLVKVPKRKQQKGRKSFQRQFIVYFFMSLLLSLTFTIIIYLIFGSHWVTEVQSKIKGNDIDEQVGKLYNYASLHAQELMQRKDTAILELNQLSSSDFRFGIYDLNGTLQWKNDSNIPTALLLPEDIVNKLNVTDYEGSFASRILPLMVSSELRGFFLLQYPYEAYNYDFAVRKYVQVLLGLAVLIPLGFFIFFTIFFAFRLERRIKGPINELINASHRIKKQDLDFNINYRENNELGDLAQAFREMKSELELSLRREWQREEDRRDMISAISHDLRTPLTVIQGNVESLSYMSKEKRKVRIDDYLKVMVNQCRRMERLLNDMYLLTLVDKADFQVQLADANISPILTVKAQEYLVRAQKKGIIFSYVNSTESNRLKAFADELRLQQVLDNLFDNAIRYTPTSGRITLKVRKEDEKIYFEMLDTGVGIAEKDLAKVFDKFYRGDSSRSQGNDIKFGSSLGLGLYISKQIIIKHAGNIRAYNNPSGGCCVELWINSTDSSLKKKTLY